MDNEELTLEEAFAQLDELTKKMEQGNLSLEETFSFYRQGLALVELCSKKIEKVETELKIINEEGNING